MTQQPSDAGTSSMAARTAKSVPDAGERDDAVRFLKAACAAIERGEWSAAKSYINGAHRLAVEASRRA